MPVALVEQDERTRVEAWRLQILLEAGWTRHRAERIAARPDVDVHQAIKLIRQGCPQLVALEILL